MAKANTGWAFIGTLPIIGYILCMITGKKDAHVKFYAKQGLVLGIASVVGTIALTVLVVTIPLIFIWNLLCLVLWVLSVVNAFSGKMKATPLIGKFAAKF